MTFMYRVALAAVVAVSLAVPVAAQQSSNLTQTDIQRLQDNVFLAERDVTQLRGRDVARAGQLQAELDDLRDEVIYLKVKLRKERGLTRVEYADVRDRIEDIRTRARGDASSAYALPGSSSNTAGTGAGARTPSASGTRVIRTPGMVEIPAGTELDVRLQNSLNSGTVLVEDRFE